MDKIRVLAVAPYLGLKEQILKVARKHSGLQVDVFIGNMEDSIRYKNLFYSGNYDVILSRGGTAGVLKNTSPVPVIEIGISVYDMIRVIRKAQLADTPFAIVGFESITSASRLICDILNYDIYIHEIKNKQEVLSCLTALDRSGIHTVIGDVITVNTADKLGMNGLLVTSGDESIENSFREIINLHNNILMSENNNGIYKSLLNLNPSLIMLLDDNRQLIYANFSAKNFDLAGIESLLADNISRIPETGSLKLLKNYQNVMLKILARRIYQNGIAYNAFFIEKIKDSHNIIKSCMTIENYAEQDEETFFPLYSSDYMRPLVKQAKEIASLSVPIFIYGQVGTGKNYIAHCIHNNSAVYTAPFITIDCANLTEKKWDRLIDDYQSPLNGLGFTIFFRDVHTLSLPMQKKILEYMIDSGLLTRHRILSSSIYNINTLISSPEHLQELYVQLNGISFYTPSLNERTADIPALCNQCINQYNIEFGKHVIGLEDGAIELLKAFHWETNLLQFHQVIKQLISSSKSSYITRETLKSHLNNGRVSASYHWVDITKPLSEIETDIIRFVISNENSNYSAAAKRLGISRSTIWRKLGGEAEKA